MARQYIAVEFRRGGQTYTYHHDGETIVPGDEVKIPDKTGDGWSRVRVVEVDWIKPPFETKAILGRFQTDPDEPIAKAGGRSDPTPKLGGTGDLFGGK